MPDSYNDQGFFQLLKDIIYDADTEVDEEDSGIIADQVRRWFLWHDLEHLRDRMATAIQQKMALMGRPGYPLKKAKLLADVCMEQMLVECKELILEEEQPAEA